MNTEVEGRIINIDYASADAAVQSIGESVLMSEICAGLDIFSAAVAARYYIAVLPENHLGTVQIAHNLGTLLARNLLANDLVQHLLANTMPVMVDAGAGLAPMAHGVGVGATFRKLSCAVLVGGEEAHEDVIGLMGQAAVLASFLITAWDRITQLACPLAGRELDCLQLHAAGASAKETAQLLGISNRTVEQHLASIRAKMAVKSTSLAAIRALRAGWISGGEVDYQVSKFSRQSAECRK